MDHLAPVLVVLVIFSTIGWVVYILAESYRRKQRLKMVTDLHTRILDRMGSTAEFAQFLQTEGGQQFIDTLSVERTHPAEKIARALQTGIIFTAVGVGFVIVRPSVDLEAEAGFTVLSALLLSLGVGFLLSAISSWMLSRSFGLFDRPDPLRKLESLSGSGPSSPVNR
jgi:hypothetical protein